MRTVTFKSVYEQVLDWAGIEPGDATTEEVRAVTGWINFWLRRAWQYFEWPELMELEERFFRAPYDAATAYAIGDEVYYAAEDKYYVATAATTGNLPTVTAYWEEQDELERYVAWEQVGETAIASFHAIFHANPRLSRTAREVGFAVSGRGAEIAVEADAGTSVWVWLKTRPNEMTATAWSTTATYADGDKRYFATDGRVYVANQTTAAGESPATDAEKWDEVPFPFVLSQAVAAGAFREWLKGEGEEAKSKGENMDVVGLLDSEVADIVIGQGQRQGWEVRTR